MRKIVLYGLFNKKVVSLFEQAFEGKFDVVEVADENDLAPLEDADYIVNRVFYMNAELFDRTKKLKMVQKWGAGVDKLDVAYAGEKGIPVVNCVGINAIPVAEMAVLLMLAAYRHIIPQAALFKEGEWPRDKYATKSYLLNGKTIGIMGFGRIGQQVCRIARDGFGADVLYYDVFRQSEEREKQLGATYCDIDTLLSKSDIVSIHMPLMDSTKGMFNKDFFKKMKPSAVIVNTARGGVINEEDLIEALKNKVIMAAGLDTFCQEPLPPTSELFKLDNVVLTPHCAGNTADNDVKMVECCIESILSFDRGEAPNPAQFVNKQYFK